MTLKAPLLQPQRAADETQADYRKRRESANNYVEAILGGTVYWNPSAQGTYINQDRQMRPHGKAARKRAKAAVYRMRAQEAAAKQQAEVTA